MRDCLQPGELIGAAGEEALAQGRAGGRWRCSIGGGDIKQKAGRGGTGSYPSRQRKSFLLPRLNTRHQAVSARTYSEQIEDHGIWGFHSPHRFDLR